MKKKLLFVNPSMKIGGAEKSLQTLLSLIDYDQYDVDLMLFSGEGELKELLSPKVNLLKESEKTTLFNLPLFTACKKLISRGKISTAVSRFLFSYTIRNIPQPRIKTQYGWKYQKKAYDTLPTEYDVAIAYLEGTPIYFCADRVRAKKKIAYIHNDYKKLDMDASFDNTMFEHFDYLVTVSSECAASLADSFPAHKDKVRVIENILAPETINLLAAEKADFGDDGYTGLRLLTMGRLDPQKGYDMAIEACKSIADKVDFRWYVLGVGELQTQLEEMIRANQLEDRFIFLGAKVNPYPYLKNCDIYVQPSRFEGKSIALEEAKCLHKPILTTAFTTVADQITDGVTGSIAEIDPASIAEKLLELLTDESLRQKYTKALESYEGNVSELQKFYALLD